jgi:hypothetical protein
MLEIKYLQTEIASIRKELQEDTNRRNKFENYEGLKKGQKSKMLARVKLFNLAIEYLKSDCTEDFISSEVKRLTNRKTKIMNEYDFWAKTPRPQQFKNEKDKLKFYQKELGIPKINSQIKTLRFILDK